MYRDTCARDEGTAMSIHKIRSGGGSKRKRCEGKLNADPKTIYTLEAFHQSLLRNVFPLPEVVCRNKGRNIEQKP